MDENNEPHTNREFRWYQAWYQHETCCRLRVQWTEDDYADIESSNDEDTAYDQSTRAGRQGEVGPIMDRVVSQLTYFSTLSCIPIHQALELSILVSATFEPQHPYNTLDSFTKENKTCCYLLRSIIIENFVCGIIPSNAPLKTLSAFIRESGTTTRIVSQMQDSKYSFKHIINTLDSFS